MWCPVLLAAVLSQQPAPADAGVRGARGLAEAECQTLVVHLVKLSLAETLLKTPEVAKLTPAERARLAAEAEKQALEEDALDGFRRSCLARFSKREYTCYLKATSMADVDRCPSPGEPL